MDTLKQADDLRSLAARFRGAANKLDEAAAILAGDYLPETNSGLAGELIAQIHRIDSGIERRGRKSEILAVLSAGPMKRSALQSALPDMPRGTLSHLLSRSPEFIRGPDGLWSYQADDEE